MIISAVKRSVGNQQREAIWPRAPVGAGRHLELSRPRTNGLTIIHARDSPGLGRIVPLSLWASPFTKTHFLTPRHQRTSRVSVSCILCAWRGCLILGLSEGGFISEHKFCNPTLFCIVVPLLKDNAIEKEQRRVGKKIVLICVIYVLENGFYCWHKGSLFANKNETFVRKGSNNAKNVNPFVGGNITN